MVFDSHIPCVTEPQGESQGVGAEFPDTAGLRRHSKSPLELKIPIGYCGAPAGHLLWMWMPAGAMGSLWLVEERCTV